MDWRGSADLRLSISRVDSDSPRSSAPTLRRAFSSRPAKSNACNMVDESRKLQSATGPRTSSVDPFKMHPPTSFTSSNLPLAPKLQAQKPRHDGACAINAVGGKQADLAGADEVNAKVSAMLAATEALKPAEPVAPEMGGSKLTRLVTKVSDAFDRVHTRSRNTIDGIDGRS